MRVGELHRISDKSHPTEARQVRAEAGAIGRPSLSLIRGIGIIVLCGVSFGMAGGLIGFTLGVGSPNYYRGVFHAAGDPNFSPVQVGLGLGISQGLIGGAVIGCIVVLAAALSSSSRRKRELVYLSDHDFAAECPCPRSWWYQRDFTLVKVLAIVLGLFACGGVSFLIGGIDAQSQLYRDYTVAKLAKIRPVLQERQFAEVNADYSSAAAVYLTGIVGSEREYKALEERMRFLFGDEEARDMMRNVRVAKK